MVNLIEKTVNELKEIAKKLGVAVGGTKAEIIERIENAEDQGSEGKTPMLGDDVSVTPIKKTLKDRQAKIDKDIKKAKARAKKAGTTYGEAQ